MRKVINAGKQQLKSVSIFDQKTQSDRSKGKLNFNDITFFVTEGKRGV